MLLGLNRLQAVNLAFGRGGDRMLAEVARRIVQVLGEELGPRGLVARVSGGEFLIASDAPLSRERWQGWRSAGARDCPAPAAGQPLA
jgi:GGDEF domain-containing protein